MTKSKMMRPLLQVPTRSSMYLIALAGLLYCIALFMNSTFRSDYYYRSPSGAATVETAVRGGHLLPGMHVNTMGSSRRASETIQKPVYVTLTTISSRIHELVPTLQSVMHGDVLPDRLFIFISRDAFLLDEGLSIDDIKSRAPDLVSVLKEYPMISVAFTANEGPHRKLLPLLAKNWNKDVLLITIDDHEIYGKTMLSSLIRGYIATNGTAVVALRSRRIAFCDQGSSSTEWTTMPYSNAKGHGIWPEAHANLLEMLVLPTGMGGVLYRPRFFHPVVFDAQLREVTKTTDDLSFRLSAMATGTPVYVICNHDKEPSCIDIPPSRHASYASKWNFAKYSASPLDSSAQRFKELASWSEVPLTLWSAQSNNSSASAAPTLVTRLRHRKLYSDREDEPAKTVSLATVFNNVHAGNTHNWVNGVKYLQEMKVFDFEAFLQYAVPAERNYCRLGSSAGSVWGVLPSILTLTAQNIYDAHCAIDSCV
jgi:hypothetical protein